MALTREELQLLKALRQKFLDPNLLVGTSDYWNSSQELKLYDRFFARRIYYKARAVFQNLARLQWEVLTPVFDWGCGTGAATEAFLDVFEPREGDFYFSDRSENAVLFCVEKFSKKYPHLNFRCGKEMEKSRGTLLLSHVLGELDGNSFQNLENFAKNFHSLVFVEAGTKKHFERLRELRERIKSRFHIWAPCLFQDSCPMGEEKNDRHWCHHFASVPADFSTCSDWADFSKNTGIDLRSLPYAFLALSRETAPQRCGETVRSLGKARVQKAVAKLLTCHPERGVSELLIEKRRNKTLFHELRKELPQAEYKFALETDGVKVLEYKE